MAGHAQLLSNAADCPTRAYVMLLLSNEDLSG